MVKNMTKNRKSFKINGISIVCHEMEDGKKFVEAKSLSKLLSSLALELPDIDLEEWELDHFCMWCL